METSEAQGLSSAGMEDMVKTLTPVIVAELAKMKPAASSPHHDQDSEGKCPSGTTVTLRGISSFITHKDLLDALEIVGKTKSLVMYRSQSQAKVRFQNDEDAEKLMSLKTLTVRGVSIKIEVKNSKNSSKRKKSPVEPSDAASSGVHRPCGTPADDAELRKTADEAQKDLTDARLLSESDFEKETEDPREEPESSSFAQLSEKFSFTEQQSADPGMSLTVGETLEMHLNINNFRCYANKKNCFTHTFNKTVFLVSNLPEYANGSYTEEDLAAHLCPYGFQHTNDSIYVIPQIRMAIAKMPSVMDLQNLVSLTHSEGILFKGNTLILRPFNNTFSMSLFGFYKSLMKVMHFRVFDNGERTVYIHDITFSQIKKLREDLSNTLHIKNFLPLMNRLFIEFESIFDADRFGICLSSETGRHSYTVYRMKPPSSPVGPLTAPEWRTPPFWLIMRTPPFLYPTLTHSISPVCVSVNHPADIEKAAVIGSEFATVILSGLPEHNYTHRDVARLVWPFFSTQNFQILNQNLYVLSLQRRAFVFFNCWPTCSKFLEEHVRTPVSFKGRALSVQVVLENIHPGSIQSNIYKSLSKWSSPLNPNPDSLDKRLLSFELSETSAGLVMMVIEVVESIAPLVNFLPLANRIYVEMVDVNSVMEVQLKIFSMEESQLPSKWKKVKQILTMSTLQQHLTLIGHIPICYEPSPPQKKKMKKGQGKAHMENGPVSPDDSNVYIANNEVPCASAVAARVLIAAEQEEALRRTGTPGSSAMTKTSPDLPEMGSGSQLTNQSQKLETNSREDAPQEEKTGGGEKEEAIEGGENFPGPLTNEELKGDQRDEDLEKSDQNKSFHEFSNKCPEGDAAAAEEGEDLEPGSTFRLVPEKPAANDDRESEMNQQQSQRGDKGNREETCLDSFTSKKESLQDSSGDVMEQERFEPAAALIRAEDQPPKETEDEVHQETMEHDDQPSRASKRTEEKEEPASRIPSSETEGRSATDETPTGGNVPADDTKKPPNIEAAPEETWTETPEKHGFGDHQPTAAKKPKRGRPKKSVPAATQSSMKTQEASGETNEEHKAPDGVKARLTHGSTAEKMLLLKGQAAEEAAVEGKEEEESKREREKSDFTQPEVRSAAGEDEEQKTSTKQKHSDNTEEAVKMEEETEEDQNLSVTPRLRGRPRKSRKAPVRRSARGKQSAAETEEAGKESLSAALQSQSDRTDGQTPGGHKQEEHTRTEAEGGREPNGSEARQSCSEPLSPSPNSSCCLLTQSVPSVRSSRRRSRLISVVSAPFTAGALPTQQKLYQQLQQEPATTFSHQSDGVELTCKKD